MQQIDLVFQYGRAQLFFSKNSAAMIYSSISQNRQEKSIGYMGRKVIEIQIEILLAFITRILNLFDANIDTKKGNNQAQAIPNSLCFAKIVFANTSRAL